MHGQLLITITLMVIINGMMLVMVLNKISNNKTTNTLSVNGTTLVQQNFNTSYGDFLSDLDLKLHYHEPINRLDGCFILK